MSPIHKKPKSGGIVSEYVSGLPVFRKPEWTRVRIEGDYLLTLSILGGNILVSEPSGFANRRVAMKAMAMVDRVVDEAMANDEPYVHISDYSGLRGVTLAARKYFMDYLRKRERLAGLIFVGTSPLFNKSINLLKRLKRWPFEIRIGSSLQESLHLALEILEKPWVKGEGADLGSKHQPVKEDAAQDHRDGVAIHPEWDLRFGDYTARFELIKGNIIHGISRGSIRVEHIDLLMEKYERIIEALKYPGGRFYMVFNLTETPKIDRRARLRYMDRMKRWYKKNRFSLLIFYGANRYLKSGIQISRVAVPWRTRLVKDLDEALKLIDSDEQSGAWEASLGERERIAKDLHSALEMIDSKKRKESRRPLSSINGHHVPDTLPAETLNRYVDQLIRYIGNIHWDEGGLAPEKGIDSSHPFSPVFDAIAFIKGELDEHFQERKKVETRLKLSEEKFRALFENAPDAYFLTDLNGTIVDGNREAEKVIGQTKEFITGKNLIRDEVLLSEQIPKARAILAMNAQGHPTGPDEFNLVQKDGKSITIEVRMQPVEIEGSPLVLGLARDITKRRKAEEALRDSEEKYRTILESIDEGYYEVDLEGNLTFVNQSMSRILGYPEEELIGLNYRQYMGRANARKVVEVFNGVYKTGQTAKGVDWEFVSKDGDSRYVETSVTLKKDPEGRPMGFRGILRDVTGRKRAEMALKAAHDELESRVRERTKNLAEANVKLKKEIRERKTAQMEAEAANRAKSDFLANMSHELRTPLNHIIGFTELVAGRNFGDINETQEEYLNDVLYSSKHLLSLINDILDLSKVEAGKLELELSEIDVKGLLENSLTMVRQKAMKHGIRLSLDVEGAPEWMMADERKLKQIIYNLLSNAVKFTPDGGEVSIRAQRIPANSDKGCEESKQNDGKNPVEDGPDSELEVSIADNGIGIAQEDLDRIFEPFEQVETTRSRKYPGTGLGLSLTKRLIELHGGRIRAESEGVGKGSTFRFFIPL